MEELLELSKTLTSIVTQVSAEGFDKSFLGARMDERHDREADKAPGEVQDKHAL